VIVNLIANTSTRAGLHVQAELDTRSYETGVKVTDDELAAIKIKRAKFHGDWNYTIPPRSLLKLFLRDALVCCSLQLCLCHAITRHC